MDRSPPIHPQPSIWIDVTEAFVQARHSLPIGHMIHSDTFNLHTAMTAVELMDPKLDSGEGIFRDVNDIKLPSQLSSADVINIMDQLLACEMSWLDAHTLPQTVFSCVYSQRMAEIPRADLFSYMRLQLATMNLMMKLIMDEKVAEEESFYSWTYGFRLSPLGHSVFADDDQLLDEILAQAQSPPMDAPSDPVFDEAISLRLRSRVHLYRTFKRLTTEFSSTTEQDATAHLFRLEQLVHDWQQSASKFPLNDDLISTIFDQSINRHLMTALPPRPSPLLNHTSAFNYLLTLIKELKALVLLRRYALPAHQSPLPPPHNRYHCSFLVALHAVEAYSARYNPRVLSRSAMSRVMVKKGAVALFENENAYLLDLMVTDVAMTRPSIVAPDLVDANALKDGIISIFKCICLNRSRQRVQILHVLKWWDHYLVLAMPRQKEEQITENPTPEEKEDSHEEQSHSQNGARTVDDDASTVVDESEKTKQHTSSQFFTGQSPMRIVAYEVASRLLVQHFLLGFEVELYQRYEYPAIFFYIGYVLTSMVNGTMDVIKAAQSHSYIHPVRFSLFLLDEARLWLSRALYSTLEALSAGEQWDYSSERTPTKRDMSMFGSEKLWYEQRFGVARGLRNTPPYADYESFCSFRSIQRQGMKAKSEDENHQDIILAQLEEGASGFLNVRKKAERAKKLVSRSPDNAIADEVLKIAAVAIENSLAVSSLIRSYKSYKPGDSSKQISVQFAFHRHHHFPVLQIGS